jgi:hypothetical protein
MHNDSQMLSMETLPRHLDIPRFASWRVPGRRPAGLRFRARVLHSRSNRVESQPSGRSFARRERKSVRYGSFTDGVRRACERFCSRIRAFRSEVFELETEFGEGERAEYFRYLDATGETLQRDLVGVLGEAELPAHLDSAFSDLIECWIDYRDSVETAVVQMAERKAAERKDSVPSVDPQLRHVIDGAWWKRLEALNDRFPELVGRVITETAAAEAELRAWKGENG